MNGAWHMSLEHRHRLGLQLDKAGSSCPIGRKAPSRRLPAPDPTQPGVFWTLLWYPTADPHSHGICVA